MWKEDYFVKSEEMQNRRDTMIVLDVQLDNIYAFKNFHLNLTYPKKIVGSCIKDEHLDGHPNFRYKKVNIIMGSNASGKTTFGHALMYIFNFLSRKNYDKLTGMISNPDKEAFFALDVAFPSNMFYRITCKIAPRQEEKYSAENLSLSIQKEKILPKDSYESCVKRVEDTQYVPDKDYLRELEKLEEIGWYFEYPRDTDRILSLPDKDERFRAVLENILKALDPSIQSVDFSQDVEKTYIVRIPGSSAILQNSEKFDTEKLSSGTKAGVEIAQVVVSLLKGSYGFYYCDEKFPYIHSDVEKAILSLMIDCLKPNDQLFFTTHNTDVLEMNLPKHVYTFLRKDVDCVDCPITCINASSVLKRNTDSLRNAVENDMFSSAPALELIYDIAGF